MSQAKRICLIFFLQPIAFGAWFPHIPGIQTSLGLSNGALAIALAGMPVGTLTALLFAGRLADWLGARRLTLLVYPLFLTAMLLPFLAPSQLVLMASLALVGGSMSILELGLNVLADDYETRTRHKIMSKAHGLWSFGLLAGTLIGSLVAGYALEPFYVGLGIAILVQAAAATVILPLPASVAEKPATARRSGFRLPHPVLLGVCFFTFGTTLVEGAVADWAAIFLRDAFTATPGIAGLGVSVFILTAAVTRLSGDRLRQKISAGRLAQCLALIGLLGLAVVWMAPAIPAAMAGLSVLGIGAALAFPLGVTAASAAPGTSPASNVAILSFIALMGFLAGPLAIGALADLTDIRTGLMLLAPMLCLSFLLAPFLTRAGERATAATIAAAGTR
ncbi:nitrate/nitrite transporter NarK [Roseibium marinum]|uniref:Nitrate/nitrite transporter NarK n=1 Tax=Roseibium marinum TaxID=281252 RepID=A0A2S3UPL8_9HYPH|nr:nitrate/nitrite transporter NarK [Roseibium marinum]